MYFLILLVASLVLSVFEGLLLKQLWVWFITPSFGLKPISLATAVGISLFLGLITLQPSNWDSQTRDEAKSRGEKFLEKQSMVYLYMLFTLAIAWVWHFYV